MGHPNPYPPAEPAPPSSRFRRWYDANWPPIAGMTSWFLGVGLLAADLVADFSVRPEALPGYGALLAAGAAGTMLGRRG